MRYRYAKTTRWLQTGAALVVAGVLMIPAGGPDPASAATPAVTPTPTPTPTAGSEGDPAPTPSPTLTVPPAQQAPSPEPSPTPADPDVDADADAADSPTVAPLAATVPPSGARIQGTDTFSNAVEASKATYPTGASTVVLVSATYPIFAPVAAPLAAQLEAPVLFTAATSLPAVVRTELQRLRPARIVVIGGPTIISDAVVTQLRTLAATVGRTGGPTAWDTSRAILAATTGSADTVYLAGGATNDDAPLAVVAAAAAGARALVVSGKTTTAEPETIAALRGVGARTVVMVGSTARLNSAYEASLRAAGFTVQLLVDADRFRLSALVAARVAAPPRSLVVNPLNAADQAIGSTLAVSLGMPLYYSSHSCLPDVSSAQISAGPPLLLMGNTYWLGAAVANGVSCAVERPRLNAALTEAVQATAAGFTGVFSVTVREITGAWQLASIWGGAQREPASMMKLFAAWAALKRMEEGRATTSTILPSGVSIGACLKVMIHASDNYCHTDIVHWIGIAELNRMIRAAGFVNTSYGTVPPGTSVLYAGNRTTTNDLAALVYGLSSRSILTAQFADYLLAHMKSQIFRTRIPSGIPPGIAQASKPGALWVAAGLLQGDTAIVRGPRSTYVISIIGDNGPPQAALRAISRTVYEHLNGTFGAAASYPAAQMVTAKATSLLSSAGGRYRKTIPAGHWIQVLDAQRVWYYVQYGSYRYWTHYSNLKNR